MIDGIKKLETFGDYVKNIPQNTLEILFVKYQENSRNTHNIEAFREMCRELNDTEPCGMSKYALLNFSKKYPDEGKEVETRKYISAVPLRSFFEFAEREDGKAGIKALLEKKKEEIEGYLNMPGIYYDVYYSALMENEIEEISVSSLPYAELLMAKVPTLVVPESSTLEDIVIPVFSSLVAASRKKHTFGYTAEELQNLPDDGFAKMLSVSDKAELGIVEILPIDSQERLEYEIALETYVEKYKAYNNLARALL